MMARKFPAGTLVITPTDIQTVQGGGSHLFGTTHSYQMQNFTIHTPLLPGWEGYGSVALTGINRPSSPEDGMQQVRAQAIKQATDEWNRRWWAAWKEQPCTIHLGLWAKFTYWLGRQYWNAKDGLGEW